MISVDALTQEEVRNQPMPQVKHSNLYLYILQQLKLGNQPAKMIRTLGIPKTTLQYYLKNLKDRGVISKLGYGTWEVVNEGILVKNEKCEAVRITMDSPQTNFSYFLPDSVRGHAFVFTLKIPKGLRNWNNESREAFLQKKSIDFTNLTVFGGGQRLLYKGRKVWLMNRSVVLYEKSSYLADNSSNAKSHAIHNFISLIKGLERLLHADFTEHAGRQYSFKVSRQHYALIKNALAEQYNANGEKLQVRTAEGNLWFIIDNSYSLQEAETISPKSADTDNLKVQNFFNSLKECPITTDFLLQAIQGIIQSQQNNQQIQSVFSENMSSHIQVLKDLGISVNSLTELIGELKEHGQLSKGQRTLEGLEEK